MDVAAAGHAAAVERLLALNGERVRGEGWEAVRTGADSNDLNGVVGMGSAADVAALTAWFGAVPATWWQPEDAELTARLEAAGWHPERTGHWCGRELATETSAAGGAERVTDLAEWAAVARACGWPDRPVDPDEWRPHWVARRDGRAVGMASAWRGEVTELVDVAVLPAYRRRGVGTELVGTVLAWAAARGAREIVAAPSPDGWALMATLGFRSAPVEPDRACYWPGLRR